MPVIEGRVFSHQVTIPRDRGCNTVIACKDLAPEDSLIGTTSSVSLLDGQVKRSPEAVTRVHTPFFAGTLPALCLDRPHYDLVLGNVPGVRASHDPDPAWKYVVKQYVNMEQAGR